MDTQIIYIYIYIYSKSESNHNSSRPSTPKDMCRADSRLKVPGAKWRTKDGGEGRPEKRKEKGMLLVSIGWMDRPIDQSINRAVRIIHPSICPFNFNNADRVSHIGKSPFRAPPKRCSRCGL